MIPFDLFAGLLLVAAVAGFVNQRWLRLPQPIGLLVIALALSAVMMVTGRLLGAAGPRTWLAGTLAAATCRGCCSMAPWASCCLLARGT